MRLALIATLAIMLIAAPAIAGILAAPSGYTSMDTTVAVSDSGLTALDYYGDNFVLFNGNDVVTVDSSGAVVNTVYQYSETVYGSFVKVVGNDVYFGENMNGTIGVASLDGSSGSIIGSLAYNYDFAVSPTGQAFVVSGGGGATPMASIWQLNTVTGATDLIASIAGPSGPIAFDVEGNLFYGSVSSVFGQTGGQSIYKWTASAVAGAIGETSLSTADASVVVSDIDSPSAFAFGPDGDLYFTSSVASPGAIWQVSNGTASTFTTLDPALGTSWLTGLRYNEDNGAFSAIGNWLAPDWSVSSAIGTITPVVPEPSAVMALASLLGMGFITKRRIR